MPMIGTSAKRRKTEAAAPEPRNGIVVHLQYATRSGRVPKAAEIEAWVRAALRGRRKNAEITVRIVGSREARALNNTWRNVDKATNVLSFPLSGMERRAEVLHGDIVVCAPVVGREAREQHKPAAAHWAHLVVHGTLHLLGYDHENDADAEVMENTEISVLRRMGYDNPYA